MTANLLSTNHGNEQVSLYASQLSSGPFCRFLESAPPALVPAQSITVHMHCKLQAHSAGTRLHSFNGADGMRSSITATVSGCPFCAAPRSSLHVRMQLKASCSSQI